MFLRIDSLQLSSYISEWNLLNGSTRVKWKQSFKSFFSLFSSHASHTHTHTFIINHIQFGHCSTNQFVIHKANSIDCQSQTKWNRRRKNWKTCMSLYSTLDSFGWEILITKQMPNSVWNVEKVLAFFQCFLFYCYIAINMWTWAFNVQQVF